MLYSRHSMYMIMYNISYTLLADKTCICNLAAEIYIYGCCTVEMAKTRPKPFILCIKHFYSGTL